MRKDIIFKEDPNFLTQSLILQKSIPVNLDNYNYPLVVYIADSNYAPYHNDSIINLNAGTTKFYFNNSNYYQEIIEYDLITCNKSNFPNLKRIDDAYLTNTLCIKNQNISLSGLYSDLHAENFFLKANLCDWNKLNNTCASKQEIMTTISNLSINLLVFDNSINFTSYDSPFIPYVNQYFSQIVQNFIKYSFIDIQYQILQTDSGFIWSVLDTVEFLQSEISSFDVFDRNDSKTVVEFMLFASNKSSTYTRSYVKIADILGNVGGILQVIIVCFSFINQPFTNIEKYVSISNSLNKINKSNNNNSKLQSNIFEINNNSKIDFPLFNNNKDINCKQLHSLKKENENISNSITFGILDNNNSNTNLKHQQKQQKVVANNNFKVSEISFYYFVNLFKCTKHNNYSESYKRYLEKLQEIDCNFDVAVLFDSYSQLATVKEIVLKHKHQINLFDNLHSDRDNCTKQQTKRLLYSYSN